MQPPYSAAQNPPQSSAQQQHFMHSGYDNAAYGNSGYGNSAVNYGNPHQQQQQPNQMMSPPSYQQPPQMAENGYLMEQRKNSTAAHGVYGSRKFSSVDHPPTLDLYSKSSRLQPHQQQPQQHYGHSPNQPIQPHQQQQQYSQSGYAPNQMTAAAPSSSSGDPSASSGSGASNSLYQNAENSANSARIDSIAIDCSTSASTRESMDSTSNHFPSTSRKMSTVHDYSMNGGAFGMSNGGIEDAADARNRSISAVNCAASSSETDSLMLSRRKSMQRQQPLNRYNSQIRQGRYSTAGLGAAYTPPPILSPMRSGSGLFWKLARNLGDLSKIEKQEELDDDDAAPPPVKRSKKMSTVHFADETEGDKLEIKTERRDSYDDDDRLVISEDEPNDEMDQCSPPLVPAERKESIEVTTSPGAPGPQRKNGLFLAGEGCSDGRKAFAAELEALRKDSETSTKSMPLSARDASQLRKFSTMSADGSRGMDRNRKLSTLSSVSDSSYYEYLEGPMHMDATPHINLGKNFQARVKKWKDREITQMERDAIPDRDECVFDCQLIDHLPQSAVAAYEALANSKAVPRPGRNKELALHLLMENKGNIQSSVMDLMRSDTLDWAQYPIIFNSSYLDTEYWSPEDIQRFQDAIYSTEKDFHLMANEMGNKTVKQLIEFYYTWKKACPDDYRKLRNLRRKRQLLEQQMCGVEELTTNTHASGEPESEMTSDAESDATNPSFMMNTDQALIHDEESDKLAAIASAVSSVRKRSGGQLDENNGFSYWHQRQHSKDPQLLTPPQSSAGNGPFAAFGMHSPSMLLQVNVNGSNNSNPASSPDSISLLGAGPGSVGGLSSMTQKHVPRAAVKKGAQPSADGFFHCRLCDKRFEKVKSLNAHMKSHAMKARAEAEALAQKNQQQAGGMTPQSQQSQGGSMNVQRQNQANVPTPFNLTGGSPSAGVPGLPGLNFDAALIAARQSAAALSRFGPLAAAAATSQAGLLNADLFANLMNNPQMHSSLQQLQNASAHNIMMFDQKSQV
uniref:C2H2-type domain-containing protein n=1 Tax=Steinernema glaseri TaxID=37863 RepID=A0A1I7Z802_9BILA